MRRARLRGKRCLDLAVAAPALVVLSPLFLALAVLVRVCSPGPALFRQTRIGQHEQPFEMYKFRTMRSGCSDHLHREYVTRMLTDADVRNAVSDGLYKLDDDPRVTRLGAILRRTSLDELPQLINVVQGNMSLVGPRPMLPWETDLLGDVHRERFSVPAGITGLWQVSGRSRLSMTEALDLDVEYARRRTLLLDVSILVRTAGVLASREAR
ncbi:sugar transferase [Pseudonocardia lutea]|uniref:Sugar transferase n=1 Tax=Pseudonocardia lutea TaxID=2172015 RepID=A0ABW1IG98_9PSEU